MTQQGLFSMRQGCENCSNVVYFTLLFPMGRVWCPFVFFIQRQHVEDGVLTMNFHSPLPLGFSYLVSGFEPRCSLSVRLGARNPPPKTRTPVLCHQRHTRPPGARVVAPTKTVRPVSRWTLFPCFLPACRRARWLRIRPRAQAGLGGG